MGGYYGKHFSKIFQGIDFPVDKGKLSTDLVDIMLLETTGVRRNNPIGESLP